MLKFNELWVHFSRQPAFSVSQILIVAITHRIIKCRLASSQTLCHGYVIKLTHIFADCNSHEHQLLMS